MYAPDGIAGSITNVFMPGSTRQRQTSTPLNEAKLHSTEPPIRPEICSMCNASPAWIGLGYGLLLLERCGRLCNAVERSCSQREIRI